MKIKEITKGFIFEEIFFFFSTGDFSALLSHKSLELSGSLSNTCESMSILRDTLVDNSFFLIIFIF